MKVELGKLLIVDDEEDLTALLEKRLTKKGYEVHACYSAEEAQEILQTELFDVGIVDIRLPKRSGMDLLKDIKNANFLTEIIMLTGHGTLETAIEAMKLGAFDYLTKPYHLKELELVIEKALEQKKLKEKNANMQQILTHQQNSTIITQNKEMQSLIQLAMQVAKSSVPVLIEGESGTGKELFAQLIHQSSDRKNEAFVAINSGAIPEQLLESELFGHVKGAFTGAIGEKKGLIEAADGGTLFLDELGEMPHHLQVQLLRFLETGKIRKVGDLREKKVDVRIVCATNKDIEKMVKDQELREDLYYRLNVIKLFLIPLRKRSGDIALLCNYFLSKKPIKKELSPRALKELEAYCFPGNVRELKHLVERGYILSPNQSIDLEHLGFRVAEETSQKEQTFVTLEEKEKQYILQVYESCEKNKSTTARVLGISVRNLYRKLEQYELNT